MTERQISSVKNETALQATDDAEIQSLVSLSDRALIFDGSCGFCTWTAGWIVRRLQRPVLVVPWQRVPLSSYGLDPSRANRSVWWSAKGTKENGQVLVHSQEALGEALQACHAPWPMLGRVLGWPLLHWLSGLLYRFVAAIRHHLPETTPALLAEDRWRACMRRGRRAGAT